MVLIAKMLANHLYIGMRSLVSFQNSALPIIECNIIWLSVLVYECIHKQCTYYVFKQQMAEQSLNKKHPDFKSTAETFVQIYKEKKQSFRHHETSVINRFVWNRSLSPWTSLPKEAGKFYMEVVFKIYWAVSLGPSSVLPPGVLTELWSIDSK